MPLFKQDKRNSNGGVFVIFETKTKEKCVGRLINLCELLWGKCHVGKMSCGENAMWGTG